MMKICIVIPPLFSIKSLESILDSISRQSYSCYEVMILGEPGISAIHVEGPIRSRIKVIENADDSVHSIFPAALNSSGDLVWIIDCVDEFDAEKLKLHVELFDAEPSIGGIRSGSVRKEAGDVYHSLKTVNSITDLEHIFLGDPVHFSDGIFRREWVEYFFSTESIPADCSILALSLNFYARVAFAGCRIVGLNKAINVRHKQVEENIKNVAQSTIRCLDRMFSDPKIAPSITRWKERVTAKAYLYWSIKAFENEETEIGQKLFGSSVQLNRSILDSGGFTYFSLLARFAIEEGYAIDQFITKNITQLPSEFAWMSLYLNESIARAYFHKAVDEIAFGRIDDAIYSISQANTYGINITEMDLMDVLSVLSDHERVSAFDAVKPKVQDLALLSGFVERKKINWIRSTWFINQAFAKYREHRYEVVLPAVMSALRISPGYIFNLGVFSIFFKSFFHNVRNYYSNKHNIGKL